MIVQAIITKYIGPTNFRGARIKAQAAAGSIYVLYEDALNIELNHAAAACKLAEKFGWSGRYFQGGHPSENGYCFVCTATQSIAAHPAFVLEPSK